MSRFFSKKYDKLIPYTPGEQPKDQQYVKLNTNESPFPPSEKATARACAEAKKLQLYSDPECRDLMATATEALGFTKDEILFYNSSDEALNFVFMAFCDKDHPAAFADITYGFYPVFADLNGVPYEKIPLREDFTINVDDYIGLGKNIFIANPNAPTGIALPLSDIERIVKSNPDNIVVIDEAYVDFGTESAVSLTRKYDNLVVTQTFSKSRSMAGARLGFTIACPALTRDLNTVKYSTNPYNVNRMSMAAGIGALEDREYFEHNCRAIMKTREATAKELCEMGFTMTDSRANFLFAKHPAIGGKDLYLTLKERGILIRHFETPRLKDYNRITIGSDAQMRVFLDTVKDILEGK